MRREEFEASVGGAMAVIGLAMLGNTIFYFTLIVGAALVILKLMGIVAWSWNVVLAPWLVDAVMLLALYVYCKPWEDS